MNHKAKQVVGGVLRGILGRKPLVRLGRFLSDQGRLDVANSMSENGERLVQASVVDLVPQGEKIVAMDVGANIGDWTKSFLELAIARQRKAHIHSFEPCAGTYDSLKANLSVSHFNGQVTCSRLAISSEVGTARFFSIGDNQGRNGLHPLVNGEKLESIEVQTTTLDAYCESLGAQRVHVVKIDTEGHDCNVLAGASRLLNESRVDVIQFEYNYRWIDSRHYLRDAFSILTSAKYQVGKVTPLGVEVYESWHPELESFREANYVGLHPSVIDRFLKIPWWNC
jgi:FkbM family methyltransferase